MKTYYHNLTPRAEQIVEDYEEITVYNTVMGVSLIEFTCLKLGLPLLQFIQGILPDSENNTHIFLALKNADDVIIKDSLWTIKEMEQYVTRILG